MGYLIFNSEFSKIISHNLETWPERSEKYRENSWWKKKIRHRENKTRLCPATGFYLNKSDWLAKHKPATSGAFDNFPPAFCHFYSPFDGHKMEFSHRPTLAVVHLSLGTAYGSKFLIIGYDFLIFNWAALADVGLNANCAQRCAVRCDCIRFDSIRFISNRFDSIRLLLFSVWFPDSDTMQQQFLILILMPYLDVPLCPRPPEVKVQ